MEPLTFEERKEIERLVKSGSSYAAIAEKLGRTKYSIRYECKRCGGSFYYNAIDAQKKAQQNVENRRKIGAPRGPELTFEDRKTIQEGIQNLLTNEQIGKLINRPATTIKNELRKLGPRKKYDAIIAQQRRDSCNDNRSLSLQKRISDDCIEIIKDGLSRGWSNSRIRFTAQISYFRLENWMNENKEEVEKIKKTKISIEDRVRSLEMQLEILLDQIQERK